jgi:large subunit ribosomal protein L3
MITGIWGRKIGMTQVFANDKVVPVTAIDVADWHVTNIKTQEKDGYDAIQVGSVRNRYKAEKYNKEWIKKPNHYYQFIREIPLQKALTDIAVGSSVDFTQLMKLGEAVDVVGTTKGGGFQGVTKRHGFTGAHASHGNTMGARPGSVGSLVKSGMVHKGKKLPGHMGCERKTIKRLEVVMIEAATKTLLVKGCVPGKSGSLVFVRKA